MIDSEAGERVGAVKDSFFLHILMYESEPDRSLKLFSDFLTVPVKAEILFLDIYNIKAEKRRLRVIELFMVLYVLDERTQTL